MARKPRINLPGYPQHVIQRGNNRQACFFTGDDYRRYREDLGEVAKRHGGAIHAYVLMTNHVHLLVTPQTVYGISHLMQDLGRRYVRYINATYRRTGTLWEGRYKASLVDAETYLLTCMRYIELNPLRARLVEHPGTYTFSSYAHNAFGQRDPLVTPHVLYRALGATDAARQHAYRELFRHHLDNDLLHVIRAALNQELALGANRFKDQIETMTSRRMRPGQPGRPRAEDAAGTYTVY